MLEITRGLLGAKMSVGEESLIIKEGNTPTSIEMGFNTSTYRSQSWLISLMRMLIVLCSEVW